MSETTYLAHYGVKGMHWGVRKDGKPQGWQGGTGSKIRRNTNPVDTLKNKWSTMPPEQKHKLAVSAASVGVGVVASAVSGGVGQILVSAAVNNPAVVSGATSAVNAAISLIGNEALSKVTPEQTNRVLSIAGDVVKRETTAAVANQAVKAVKKLRKRR